MQEEMRFRNHISIVAEQIWSALAIALAAVVGGLLQDIGDLADGLTLEDGDMGKLLVAGIGGLVILILALLWRVVVWARTYICLSGTTLVVERNTLNRKKHTIGVQNISNVNVEQNLFEMLIGTCKVKVDTNSLSTANSTDVKIVLKKEQAEEFRRRLAEIMETPAEGVKTEIEEQKRKEPGDALSEEPGAPLGAIMIHGFFSMSLFSVLVALGCIVGAVTAAAESLGEGNAGKSMIEILLGGSVVVIIFASVIWDIVKGFIKYYDFKVRRLADRLYISYGLLKKVSYTVPVDKINGLKLTQSWQARLTGRCMAEIINVGMGDDQEEQGSFLLLYEKREKIAEKVGSLLSEFSGVLDQKITPQPAGVWIVWLFPIFLYLLTAGAFLAGVSVFAGEYLLAAAAGTAVLTGFVAVMLVCRYRTAGTCISRDFLILSTGYLGKRYLAIRFGKIQYVRLKQNFLARHWNMQKGNIHLLAATGDREHTIPYFPEALSEELKDCILYRKRGEKA